MDETVVPFPTPEERAGSVLSEPVTSLPFVKDLPESGPSGRPRTFWAPDVAGLDYFAASDLGTDLAIRAVRWMEANDFVPLLGWVVFDMPRDATGAEKAVQVSFLSAFAQLAMIGARRDLEGYERYVAESRAFIARLRAEQEEDDEDGTE